MKTLLIVFLFVFNSSLVLAQTVTTLAGSGTCGFANGSGTIAAFAGPAGICTDPSGNIYVMDQGSGSVRKITPGGTVSSLANIVGMACGICSDPSGNLYVAGTTSRRIYKVTPTGSVSTFAGGGQFGCANGTGTLALFGYPIGICSDAFGNIYVADLGCSSVRKITPGGVVTTYAGSGSSGFANGPSTLASFNGLNGVYADASGNIFVSDGYNHALRKIDQNGMVSTVAGTGSAGFANGTGTLAAFNAPYSVCGDNSGNIYVSEFNNDVIRKITPIGVVTVYAGTGSPGFVNGPATVAKFNIPTGVCMDTQGNYYVSEAGNCVVRKITTDISVTISQTANILCHGLSTGALTSAVTGGVPPYTYTWSGTAGNSPTASNLPAGIYTLTVSSSNSMVTVQTYTISQPAPINLNAFFSNSIVCLGESTTLTGSGADTYNWSNGIVNGIAFFPTSTAVYTLAGTNTLTGCTSTLSLTLNVSACTSISNNSISTSPALSIFPNPSGGHFTIKAQTETAITLRNELGQIVKELFCDSRNNYECWVSDLTNGVYLLTANCDPFVKQKIVVSK